MLIGKDQGLWELKDLTITKTKRTITKTNTNTRAKKITKTKKYA